jgi:hypothetical protein
MASSRVTPGLPQGQKGPIRLGLGPPVRSVPAPPCACDVVSEILVRVPIHLRACLSDAGCGYSQDAHDHVGRLIGL